MPDDENTPESTGLPQDLIDSMEKLSHEHPLPEYQNPPCQVDESGHDGNTSLISLATLYAGDSKVFLNVWVCKAHNKEFFA